MNVIMKSPSCADSIYPDSFASHSQTMKVIHSKLIPERRQHSNTAETKNNNNKNMLCLPINTYLSWIGMTDCFWSVNLQFPICLFSIVWMKFTMKRLVWNLYVKIVMAYVHSTSCSFYDRFGVRAVTWVFYCCSAMQSWKMCVRCHADKKREVCDWL